MIFRHSFLWLSEQRNIQTFVLRNAFARRMASRFVAGERLDDAIGAVRGLNERGITASIDLLGESVSSPREVEAAQREYLAILDRIHADRLDANISVKLTLMGIDLGDDVCVAHFLPVLERAMSLGTFVRIDMESSAYTERTLRLFHEIFFPRFGPHVGVVIQSYLRRSEQDVRRLIEAGARVRLCKGAYQEPASVAFPAKADVDRNFVRLLESLLTSGRYPAVATHDERMLSHAKQFASDHQIDNDRFEFQMIYGVRRDLQVSLREAGYNMRVYVPYGAQWYPYFMRRLAERPANVMFLLNSIARESRRS